MEIRRKIKVKLLPLAAGSTQFPMFSGELLSKTRLLQGLGEV